MCIHILCPVQRRLRGGPGEKDGKVIHTKMYGEMILCMHLQLQSHRTMMMMMSGERCSDQSEHTLNPAQSEACQIARLARLRGAEEDGQETIAVTVSVPGGVSLLGLRLANVARPFKHSLLQRIVVTGIVPGSPAEASGMNERMNEYIHVY